jgi:hypothetical protein
MDVNKYKDLKRLCDTGVIPNMHRDCFYGLSHNLI